jgi:uncharacterized membrane protein (DUF4010 family)
MNDPNVQTLTRLVVALAIGLLIGLERGWEQREMAEGERVAGFRTFGLVGLLGAATVVIAEGGNLTIAAVVLVLGFIAALGYYRRSRTRRGQSATGMVALLLTFALGAMAGRGLLEAASSAAVVVTLLLSVKPELHGFLRRIERKELLGTIRLLLISVVMLPVLPDRGLGPWHALNPYRLWWMVVLVAGISYLGYLADRLWGGRRGSLVTGLFGGLASSTAVAVALSRRSPSSRRYSDSLAAGIVVASSVMFPRLFVVVLVVAAALARRLAAPIAAAALVGLAGAVALTVRQRGEPEQRGEESMRLRNPLDLSTAFKFGVLLTVIMVGARAVGRWGGDRGLYLAAGAAGLADVDAIALSVASMWSHGEVSASAAATAVLIAAAVNTLMKSAIAFVLGGGRLGVRVAVPLAVALTAGAVTAVLFPP